MSRQGFEISCLNNLPTTLFDMRRHCVERSFNSVTVDGDTSTNDTVAIFANGQAGNAEINDPNSAEFKEFQDELLKASIFLAKELVRDGEGTCINIILQANNLFVGATKVVTIHIKGAATAAEAKTVANSISQSSLVKTAIFGQDANWGRVLAAVGYPHIYIINIYLFLIGNTYSGVNVVPEKISLWFAKTQEQVEKGETSHEVLPLLKNGTPLKFDEAQALELMKNKGKPVLSIMSIHFVSCRIRHCGRSWTRAANINYVDM